MTTVTNFNNFNNSTQHYSADCLGAAADAEKPARLEVSTTRVLYTLLLSAMVATVMVVSYVVMDTPDEGGLLMMWMTMWFVGFAAIVFLSSTARELAQVLKSGLDAWSRKTAKNRADERFSLMAQQNPELWADIQAAKMRGADVSAPIIAYADRIVSLSPAARGEFPRDYI